jgi:hypothetical protein
MSTTGAFLSTTASHSLSTTPSQLHTRFSLPYRRLASLAVTEACPEGRPVMQEGPSGSSLSGICLQVCVAQKLSTVMPTDTGCAEQSCCTITDLTCVSRLHRKCFWSNSHLFDLPLGPGQDPAGLGSERSCLSSKQQHQAS